MKGYGLLGAAVSVIGALSPIACPHASAAAASSQTSPTSGAARVKELERRLDQRDAVIRDLQQRVERLEREQSARAPAAPTAPANAPPKQAQNASPANVPPQAVAQASRAPSSPSQGAPQAGPGEFTVSEEAAQRALERALVQTGAALLPRGKFEFVPSVVYQYQRISTPGQLALTPEGAVLITENVFRNTQVQANALLRMGLPWDMQVEVGVPWAYKDNTIASRVGGSGFSATGRSVQGVGDPSISLTKQILAENDLRPGLFASVGWSPDLGEVKEHIPLGRGFDQLTAGIVAVKRQDPLVFTGGFNYINSRENNGFQPGGQYITSLGMIFAISPETSLQFGQQIIFYGEDSFNGRAIPGSKRTSGIFSAGLLSVLGRNRVVNFSVGIGETSDAPNFVIQLAMPIRLN